MHQRKASISLSTSAIVILILSVVVLGLVITFVTYGFHSANREVTKLASDVADPASPSSANPITISAPGKIQPGEDFVMKIGVYNTDSVSREVSASVDCGFVGGALNVDTTSQFSIVKIEPGSSGTLLVVGKPLSSLQNGKLLCTALLDDGSGGSGPLSSQTESFSLTVSSS